MCGIYYLGALRAGEEMARAVGDAASAAEYRAAVRQRQQVDRRQPVQRRILHPEGPRHPKDKIATVAAQRPWAPRTPRSREYQVGDGCLVDQLVGQYLAEVAGLGPLVVAGEHPQDARVHLPLQLQAHLAEHDTVQRIYALNDEAALVICDYGKAERPRIPFPYYAEVWTGIEYSAAAQMIYAGMVREGVECVRNTRLRYDGERRNPWDEPECGHHYARAMSAWSGMLALSGFRYHGPTGRVAAVPRIDGEPIPLLLVHGTGWGTFSIDGNQLTLRVIEGKLPCQSCELRAGAGTTAASLNGKSLSHKAVRKGDRLVIELAEPVVIDAGGELRAGVRA